MQITKSHLMKNRMILRSNCSQLENKLYNKGNKDLI